MDHTGETPFSLKLTRRFTFWLQQIIFLLLRLPSKRAMVKLEMDKAKLEMEDKLLPKGPDVVRHLSIPNEGK